MRISFDRKFIKMYAKAPQKVQKAFKDKQELFLRDPHNPQLNNHQLSGKYRDCRSINVSGDWRAIFVEKKAGVYFRLIGTHGQLYK